ncbi:MAG: NAD(P) transhydrogenase subunit alpha [Myxococcales bacterium]|nr:MAG: NAD(P) transhydrogenase subunit alpha [Myxococcales bacterium]
MSEFSLNELSLGLYVLVLASFIGFEIISKVPTMLHTPLMSGSNAISGIILLGALVVASESTSELGSYIAYGAIFLATINVVGGFWVTDRMLGMFRAKKGG